MSTGVASWSQTAANNASADSTVNWAEGQAPSTVNDSARAMMASVAKWRDDISGAITATGTASAYAITSNQGFASFTAARLSTFTFLAPATNAAGVTLNLDGSGAQPINGIDGVAIPAGTLVSGGVYQVTAYTNEWILHSVFGGPSLIPIGGLMDFVGTTAPAGFAFPYGQAISRTTYSTLFALTGTTYGTGDGSTTFNIPDLRGRIIAGKDDMGGSAASRVTTGGGGVDGVTLGAAGGAQNQTLTLAQLPTGINSVNASQAIAVSQTVNGTGNVRQIYGANGTFANANATGGGSFTTPAVSLGGAWEAIASISGTNSISVTSNNTSGSAHTIMQPTIILNKLLRII